VKFITVSFPAHSRGTGHVCIRVYRIFSMSAISGCRREVDEIWDLLSYYAAHSANSLPTFLDNLSVPSLRFKRCWIFLSLTMGHILTLEDGTERSVMNYQYRLRSIAEDSRSQFVCAFRSPISRPFGRVCVDEEMMDCSTSGQVSILETSTCNDKWPARVRLTHLFVERNP